MVYLFNLKEKVTADIKKVCRYLGIKTTLHEELYESILEVKKEIEDAARLSLCYTKLPLNPDCPDLNGEKFNSENLKKNLKGCREIYIFAATAGIEIDRIINRYLSSSPSKAVIAQASGTALIEKYCDLFCEKIAEEEKKRDRFLRPRFSPGYGDFNLSYQKNILDILSAQKYGGITLTDSLLMVPVKSVTAVIGVSDANAGCIISGCESCNKKDCIYKRG